MTKLPWYGSWEETLHAAARPYGKERLVFYVPVRALRRLSCELGNRAVGTFGTIVNSMLGDVYCLGSEHEKKITLVYPGGIEEFDITEDVYS